MILLEPMAVAVTFALSVTFLVVIVGALWWMDRFDREPITMVVSAYLWGAVLAPLVVLGAETLLNGALSPANSVLDWRLVVFGIAPLAIEVSKAVGIFLVLYATRTFDSPTDGFVYGAAVGAGFAVTGPLVSEFASGGGPGVESFGAGIAGFAFWSIGLHVLASSVLGACIGAGRLTGSWARRCLWGLTGLVGAVFLHAIFTWIGLDLVSQTAAVRPWMVTLTLYALLAAVLGIILLAEERILKRQLADEVRLGVLPEWTAKVIPCYLRRVRSDWWHSRRERTVISRLLTRLAFRKEALTTPASGCSNLEGLEIVWLRERIQKIIYPPKNPISPLTEDMW